MFNTAKITEPEDIFNTTNWGDLMSKKNGASSGIPLKQLLSSHLNRGGTTTLQKVIDELPEEDPAEIVSRKDWSAREPSKPGKKVATPVKILVLKYGTKTDPCESKEECIKTVQEIQRRHMDELGMEDIGYNFLVSSDGTIYEGRGWTTRTRRYPVKDERYKKLNKRSIDVVFIGNWTDKPPLADMISAVADLCVEGEKKGFLHPDWMVFGPTRLKKTIAHGSGPLHVKSKRDEKYNIGQYDKHFNPF